MKFIASENALQCGSDATELPSLNLLPFVSATLMQCVPGKSIMLCSVLSYSSHLFTKTGMKMTSSVDPFPESLKFQLPNVRLQPFFWLPVGHGMRAHCGQAMGFVLLMLLHSLKLFWNGFCQRISDHHLGVRNWSSPLFRGGTKSWLVANHVTTVWVTKLWMKAEGQYFVLLLLRNWPQVWHLVVIQCLECVGLWGKASIMLRWTG